MTCHYCLSVAGITICFASDRLLVQNEEFLPFIINTANTTDIHSTIRMTAYKPKVPEKPLYSDMFCAVAKNKDGYLQKFFFGNCDEHDDCVVSTYDPDGRHILIEYPSAYADKDLQLRSCFYWLGFESYLLRKNKLCLHASLVDTPFGGILFSGASGIGKSTQAELWCRYRGARQINGDRPILSKESDGWSAWGSPYAGSSKVHVNACCPVRAIVLLRQAPVCSLRNLSPGEAFRGVWAGLTVHTWDKDFVEKASALAIDLISSVPVIEFGCTPDKQAVDYLEQALQKELCL